MLRSDPSTTSLTLLPLLFYLTLLPLLFYHFYHRPLLPSTVTLLPSTGASTNSYGPVNLKYTTGKWTLGSEVRYVYDGMRVIQERDSANAPTVSYTRSRDLGGSLEGAGGIGGLLPRSHGYSGGSWGTHNYYHADGAGNITMLIDGSQVTVASYRYDPYGNTISSSGGLAGGNVYRFSSKEIHANSGLYYYGYRSYDPNLQRWPNRDPIKERGGINLYRFARNSPLDPDQA